MQIQLDPNIPANLSPEQLRDFKSFLDVALDGLTTRRAGRFSPPETRSSGDWRVIVVVLNGAEDRF